MKSLTPRRTAWTAMASEPQAVTIGIERDDLELEGLPYRAVVVPGIGLDIAEDLAPDELVEHLFLAYLGIEGHEGQQELEPPRLGAGDRQLPRRGAGEP